MKFIPQKFLALLCLVALVCSSCATKANDADDRSRVRVGIVFDIGGKDDRSFNAAAFEGVKRAERELGIVLRRTRLRSRHRRRLRASADHGSRRA
jgi:basic membrane lipoprotein Med (substrate-binding protein (PBP1-ABC) superfamily)